MKILVLGGTVFLGRGIVEAAVAQGHEVTLFNRGTNPQVFPQVEQLLGDRDGNLTALEGRQWDVVIDTCGYVPRLVRYTAELLRDVVQQYIFISTVSVYADTGLIGLHEESELGRTLADPTSEKVTGESYGPLKVLCEELVTEIYGPGRSLILRPGLIVGPHDPTDRFTYWPYRLAHQSQTLIPGRPERPIQFIDVRDIGDFTIHALTQKLSGVYNLVGPAAPLPMGELVAICQKSFDHPAEPIWMPEQFLLEQGVEPWSQLPFWFPEDDPERRGLFQVSNAKAVAAGLTFRPVAQTVQDTLAWANTRSKEHVWRVGLTPEREKELITLWKKQ